MAAKIPLSLRLWEERKEQELLNSSILIQYGQLICDSGCISSGLLLLCPLELLTFIYPTSESVSFCTHFVLKAVDGGAALTILDAKPTEIKRKINWVFIKSNLNIWELGSVKLTSHTIRKFWFLQVLIAWLEPGQKIDMLLFPLGQNKN